MVAAIELEKYAIGHDMSNQESRLKTKHLPSSNTKLDRPGKLVATYNFAASRFYTAKSLFRTYSDNAGLPRVVILAQPPLL